MHSQSSLDRRAPVATPVGGRDGCGLPVVAVARKPLLDYDEDRGTNLARVLELALDFQRRDDAARAGYMHRNTFRRQLAHALDLVTGDLDDRQDRLALQLALRLRCLRRSREGVAAGNGRQRTRPTPVAAAL
jgi:PucR C-terminal helix-turn-helix domain